MPAILIAEDHMIVRMGTIVLIKELFPDANVTEAGTFDETLKCLAHTNFDLLLLDIHLPGGDNLQMVEAVKLRQPDIPVLVFSSYDEHLYARSYIQAGALGYVHKNSSRDEIKTAIKRVLNKEKYISASLQQQLLNDVLDAGGKKRAGLESLSARELEVMRFLIKGMTPSEIKEQLNIGYSSISTYKERIFSKMGVSNVIELINKLNQLNPGS
jgi:two-component system invasion response regulator UvrY